MAIARAGIGRKFQVPRIFAELTVAENMTVPLLAGSNPYALMTRQAPGAEIGALLRRVRLEGRRDTPAGRLSHGEKQWLEIAMVAARAPRLMLLDEPTAGNPLTVESSCPHGVGASCPPGFPLSRSMTQSDAVWHGTTVLSVRRGGKVVMAGDGQVTMGATVVKSNANKIRRLGAGDILAGFAGATADAFTLFERLEAKLERHPGQLARACVELAKDWRTDRYLRRLEALMAVADGRVSLVVSGSGDVLEPEDGIIGIGSGGPFALSAARALAAAGETDAEAIARRAMAIAAEICIYTNDRVVLESLESR
ncbi:MAG: ATP-dependent protease subunit HslV [Alphaproteobacteria bacterium]|nr:ATP-dependent protease subunit HslV [Alphaproteobacteria bacterium]